MPMGMKKGEWYPEHILSWLEHRDDKNVMFVHYEDFIDVGGYCHIMRCIKVSVLS